MITTIELIAAHEAYAVVVITAKAKQFFLDTAQRLRELQAQVDSLERHILGGAVKSGGLANE